MSTPTLSFFYQLAQTSRSGDTGLTVSVDDGTTEDTLLSANVPTKAWTHRWFDLTPWSGKEVTLTFGVHLSEEHPLTWAYLDEVTLGSGTHPDLWVSTLSQLAAPGEQVTYGIAYGNRGDGIARNAQVTATLPAALALVASDPPALTLAPALTWDVGQLSALGGRGTVSVTVVVSDTVQPGTVLIGDLDITTTTDEIVMENNRAFWRAFVGGAQRYLPTVLEEGGRE